jgi:glycosyltransferase involved in cell wall biosynthesis
MLKISVVIITLNEERNLERCLKSVQEIADETIVVDSYSNDQTETIAKRHHVRFVSQSFLGYVEQKNFATALAKNDWVLSLDADEELSPELIQSIKTLQPEPQTIAYKLSRYSNYCGKWIKHSGWYPDVKVRLFNRHHGQWEGEKIHEYWQPKTKVRIHVLKGYLFHYTYHSVSDYFKQIEHYSEILAWREVDKGNTTSLITVALAPVWKFFYNYFIRLGFLDGYEGYVICKLSAFASFAKYSKVYQYTQLKRSKE